MGYLRGSQEKRKNKSSDSAHNHVDRVRLHDTSHVFGGPGRGSGWRQRSLSNIDLTSQSRHSFTKQIRDYSSGLYDLYSRIESRKDYQQNSYEADEKQKSETTIYDHVVPTLEPTSTAGTETDSCSLRRTRSLAVIREETYNDLQISGVRTRRSQLIPRAKLVNRSFFKNRIKQKYRDEDSGSGVDTQTSETRESDDYYANLKRLESEKEAAEGSWQTEKSDLDSLDSGYFKNSHHQTVSKTSAIDEQPTATTKHSTKYQVLEIEVHNQKIRHSSVCTTETTTTTHSDISSDVYSTTTPLQEDDRKELQHSTTTFEDVGLTSEKESSDSSLPDSTELNINYNTLTLTRHKLHSDSDEGTFEKKSKFKEDRKSVVSYDSIYLSSEGSNDELTIVEDECLEDPLPELRINSAGELDVNDQINNPTTEDTSINLDCLYSQINKVKPKILSLEPKSNLTSFSDTSTRGTLERLTFISSSAQQKEYQQIEERLYATGKVLSTGAASVDNQYCSLPDANIGISLRASERIDAKLRLSCSTTSEVIEGEEISNTIYDSISRFGQAHKRLRQRESFEIVVLNPISIDEQPKEAPSIEVSQPQRKTQELVDTVVSHPVEPVIVDKKLVHPIEKKVETHTTSHIPVKKAKEVLPTTICLGKKQVIVDELAAKTIKNTKREKEQREQNISRTQLKAVDTRSTGEIKPPVKQLQPIRKELKSFAPLPTHTQEEPTPKNAQFKPKRSLTDLTPESYKQRKNTAKFVQPKVITHLKTVSKIPKPPPLPPPPQEHIAAIALTKPKKLLLSITAPPDRSEALRNEFKANLTDTLKKRIAQTRRAFNGGETFKARPIRISSVENISKLSDDTYEINPLLTYKVKLKDHRAVDKMSRPQILNVIDTKRNVCSVAPRQNFIDPDQEQSKQLDDKVLSANGNRIVSAEVQQEFQEKVDAVRCYWSKLIDKKDQQPLAIGVDEVDRGAKVATENVRNFVTSAEQSSKFRATEQRAVLPQLRDNADDVTSFSPMVEIIELDGQKQAAVVNARCIEDQDFDHVRYKVMKSDTFQKNILTQSRKEAQFDGLLQYLHNYSFQELLANNNVVIIEPIRTKIEKIPGKSSDESPKKNCKITGGAGRLGGESKGGIKRHFFYHPIRVNKELLEEELPTPDTVRNARKLFEETLRLRTAAKYDSAPHCAATRNTDNLRKRALRYLTIDTSYGDGQRKWDSSSMSSGISSGELSSPCECNEHGEEQKDMFSSEENICADDMCESYYVSQDVLAKIRECGSSVTYYGGRVVDNKLPEASPMTKAIMQEIRGTKTVCGACQPNNCPHADTVFPISREKDNSLGLKFKLVKSNSCSSRLELAGTGLDEKQLRNNQTIMETIQNRSSSPPPDAEASVRTLVSRLEVGAINQKSMPRIIESKCIEKMADSIKTADQQEQHAPLTVNNHAPALNELQTHAMRPVDILTQVTVNNHIGYSAAVAAVQPQQKQQSSPSNDTNRANKIGRNRNVDLAFSNVKPRSSSRQSEAAESTLKPLATPPTMPTTTTITKTSTPKPLDQASHTNSAVSTTYLKNAKNLLNHNSDAAATTQPPTMVSTRKDDGNHNNRNDVANSVTASAVTDTPLAPRLVKWNTLGKFDEKNYVTNDVKLKQKPKYDEIEFEEFEVFDPSKPPHTECYDSLNEK